MFRVMGIVKREDAVPKMPQKNILIPKESLLSNSPTLREKNRKRQAEMTCPSNKKKTG